MRQMYLEKKMQSYIISLNSYIGQHDRSKYIALTHLCDDRYYFTVFELDTFWLIKCATGGKIDYMMHSII